MRRYGAAPLQPDMRGNTPLDLSRHAAVRPAVPHEAGRGEVYTLLAPTQPASSAHLALHLASVSTPAMLPYRGSRLS